MSSNDKREIWCTLSDLFLDTDISISLERISDVCAKSDFSIDEITDMLYSEVAPVCMPNLLTVTEKMDWFRRRAVSEKNHQLLKHSAIRDEKVV